LWITLRCCGKSLVTPATEPGCSKFAQKFSIKKSMRYEVSSGAFTDYSPITGLALKARVFVHRFPRQSQEDVRKLAFSKDKTTLPRVKPEKTARLSSIESGSA
jgi:hypothetical protein